MKRLLAIFALLVYVNYVKCQEKNVLEWLLKDTSTSRNVEYEGYDGWYNNLAKPSQGAVDTPLFRFLPPAYPDGVYQPVHRPTNPFNISLALMQGENGMFSKTGKTAFLVFFGQQVVEEILDSQGAGCPPEYWNIEVPKNHPYKLETGLNQMPILRTRYDMRTGFSPNNPRQQLGEDFPAKNTQRLPMANPPPPTNHSIFTERGYTAPVDRFFRERVFNEARRWVIASYQSIVIYDWLPKWLQKELPAYSCYKPNEDPQISQVFQSAAMRFGHTLVTSGVHLRDTARHGCRTTRFSLVTGSPQHKYGIRTCNSFWRSTEVLKDPKNFNRLLGGMSSQSAEREDNVIVLDLRGKVFGPLEFSRRDLMAINIQRGRDHGLPSYNVARKYFGLEVLPDLQPETFKRITLTEVPDEVLQEFQRVYDNDPDSVDIWAGGLMETQKGPGQLFLKIIEDQFQRIRDGDRFWFENTNNGLRQIKIIDVILEVTNLAREDIQIDPFTVPHDNNDFLTGACKSERISSYKLYQCTPPGQKVPANCSFLPPLGESNLESCTDTQTYDYFDGSDFSYLATILLGIAMPVICLIGLLAFYSGRKHFNALKRLSDSFKGKSSFLAKEKISFYESRQVKVNFQYPEKAIIVKNFSGKLLRRMDLHHINSVLINCLQSKTSINVKVKNHYDLFLKFKESSEGEAFHSELCSFCESLAVRASTNFVSRAAILKNVTTCDDRSHKIQSFSRLVFQKAFQSDSYILQGSADILGISSTIQLTLHELAKELGMDENSIFVRQLFKLMDKDHDGFIILPEFWNVMVIFAKGSLEDKIKLMFEIYDLDGSGDLSIDELKTVVRTMMSSEEADVDFLVNSMLGNCGLLGVNTLSFDQFKSMLMTMSDVAPHININIEGDIREQKGKSRFSLYGSFPGERKKKHSTGIGIDEKAFVDHEKEKIKNGLEEKWYALKNYIRTRQLIIFWAILYDIVLILIVAERAYYYSVEREHAGLRGIAGYGVTFTRGAASGMMFTYSSLMITMCRNIFCYLRSTVLHEFFPFDYMIEMHRHIAYWALFWTLVHVIGHCINFYHISTQTAADLTCLFRDFYRASHVLPKFTYWCWETITGLTGVFLTWQTAIIYILALGSRRHFFNWFWNSHNTYPIFYLLIVLHGSGNLVQPPLFHYFFLGPCIIFTIDKLVSVSRRKVRIEVLSAKHLPSNVTLLKIRRPPNFSYQSGQWIGIACPAISDKEYHPFTISSAPHENELTLHVRAVGPWTQKLRVIYKDCDTIPTGYSYPKIYMDGPFGEGHQSWLNYEVVVLVGGGIGVTPFSSILKDLAYRSQQPVCTFKTKKVLFLWVTRSQKQFEWMTETLRIVEEMDTKDIIRNHIFITQFKSKYDLRTIMLYLAERHFQKISGTSLFTGTRAITHFSRPNFESVFTAIKAKYGFIAVLRNFTMFAATRLFREAPDLPKVSHRLLTKECLSAQ